MPTMDHGVAGPSRSSVRLSPSPISSVGPAGASPTPRGRESPRLPHAARRPRTGDRAAAARLELDVANFGPIVRARIALRPLTVFVGPGNAGKSYLATLLYALHRAFHGACAPGGRLRGHVVDRFAERRVAAKERASALVDVARPLIEGLRADGTAQAPPDRLVLPPILADFYRRVFDAEADALRRRIDRSFGVGDVGALVRDGQRESSVALRRRFAGGTDPVAQALSLGRDGVDFRSMVPSDAPIPLGVPVPDPATCGSFGPASRWPARTANEPAAALVSGGEPAPEIVDLASWLGAVALSSLIRPLHSPAHYLPADRVGAMPGGGAPVAGRDPTAGVGAPSGVAADFGERLLAIDRIRGSRPKLGRHLAENLESTVLGGSIRVNRSRPCDHPSFAYRPRGWTKDVPLANASSMVRELAPLALYLRHAIGPGDALAIEEPEAHLHPETQVELARQIADVVNAGVRVIVTTHSEWMLDELANIVRRSQIPDAARGDGERRRRTLHGDQVGAWILKPKRRPRGSVVEEIPLSDVGQYPAGFDAVAHALHNDWADIQDRVQAGS